MKSKNRLTKLDWLEAARTELQEKGLEGVKVERLARRLGVSKGSFYWHFKNRPALLEGLLEYWEQATDWLIEQSSQAETPKLKMTRLFELIAEQEVTGEVAIFTWAKQDDDVKRRVRCVEEKRIGHLQDLFVEYGFPDKIARERAEIANLAFAGYVNRLAPEDQFSLTEFGQVLINLLFVQKEEKRDE